mgnify:CR=1 FL=1
MASENVFSTPRKEQLTADQMLENAIRLKNERQRNVTAMMEANKLRASNKDFTTAMETTNVDVEKQLAKDSAMEAAAYKIGSRNVAMAQLGLKQKMIQEGTEYITNKVLGELIYECYWLDDSVKECTSEEIGENIENVLGYIEESFKDSKVSPKNYSKLMESLTHVITETAEKAANRICEDCEKNDTAFADFELTDAEEEELDDKLIDLGRDEIVDLIKTKVASVVQDEKEKGEARSEMFKAIDEMSKTDSEASEEEEPTEAEEATLAGIHSGEITLEGATWDTLKVIFSDNKKKANAAYKTAAKLAKSGQYDAAAKEYENAKKIFKEMLNDVKSTDESVMSTVCSFLLSGWLEHAFIASIGGPSAGVSITKAVCVTLTAAFGMSIPYSIILQLETNQENVKKDGSNYSTNDYKVHAISALELNIKMCDSMIKECKNKGRGQHTMEASFATVTTDSGYTAAERHIAKLMENGAPINLFDDPTWGEFKSYVSLQCKHIKDCLGKEKPDYKCVLCLIEDLEKRLEGVPENIPTDTKMYVMAMVNMIYTAVPPTEIIISRFGNPLGAPDLQASNPVIDYSTISWTDLFVNIKTNLASVKDFCNRKADCCVIDEDHLNNSDCPVTGKNSLAQKIAQTQSRIIAQNIGGSLFEAMMMGSMNTCEKAAMESSANISEEDVEDAALIEALLNYTVFETLDTIGMYKFGMNDVKQAKKAFMYPTLEGIGIMSSGKNKKGLKKVRINTKKMKSKRFIIGDTDKPGILAGK